MAPSGDATKQYGGPEGKLKTYVQREGEMSKREEKTA